MKVFGGASATPLPRSFYARPTLEVARDMLGALLVRRWKGRYLTGRIVEVEAYIGEKDPACHAYRGRTPRNEVMYGAPGHAYVYFTYGMHCLLNAVTEPVGFPAAVLIRALEPLAGVEQMRRLRASTSPRPDKKAFPDRELTSGPARLCAALKIDLTLNGSDLTAPPVFLAASSLPTVGVRWSSRVGIRAGRDRLWRAYLEGNPFVSRSRLPR
ncbi:MAG: DNA-3-methyladenine glycosylase [Acidobacteriota bacterium]